MDSTFDWLMQDACNTSLDNEYKSLEQLDFAAEKTKALSQEAVQLLSQKISVLPAEYLNIVFFRYCFEFSPSDTSDMLEADNVVGKLRYIRKMLSYFMDLGELLIDDSSMQQASCIALKEYTPADGLEIMGKPRYSAEFQRKLKMIAAAQSTTRIITLMIKRVAVFFLICTISFSTALVANAELRESFFNWVVETFPQFSVFVSDSSETHYDSVKNLTIGYIPNGFELVNVNELHEMLIYNYLNNDKRLTIKFAVPNSKKRSYYDTEDAEIKEITLKDSKAYTWQKDELTYLIWSQDNIECYIIAQLNYEEVLEIAKNIKK